ncbi:GNAT family N-acetyltransferase [Pseudomonas putida]|uniref:GNAT family N-acetyltransferase n=1 Tax=Pseudomonas putida TaxID=303 RepID=UPI0018D71E94|nr:GNAT family N-acetyltransferase [Pseudomonas putida]MBH3409874.1 GNAT family N-acetyltransferase [Pseudomonas putida]
MELIQKKFKNINLQDAFFESLLQDYNEFADWFARKAEDSAYIFEDDAGNVNGFLYLKTENEAVTDVEPNLPAKRRIKVGTMKINARGTKLGERFLKKIFDHALYNGVDEIYVTVFPHHEILIGLFEKYGFSRAAEKHSDNGTELVLVKKLHNLENGLVKSYPMVNNTNANRYLLSLKPEWHTRLLPDSILHNENARIIEDVSHTNSIHKVYLAAMQGLETLRPGDILLIYRTSDGQGPAHYRSVATSVGVVEEYRSIHSFTTRDEFMAYCRPYSVFSEGELNQFWARKNYPHVFRFTYNAALKRRVTRGEMIERFGLDPNGYWGFMALTQNQFDSIIRAGQIDEGIVIN